MKKVNFNWIVVITISIIIVVALFLGYKMFTSNKQQQEEESNLKFEEKITKLTDFWDEKPKETIENHLAEFGGIYYQKQETILQEAQSWTRLPNLTVRSGNPFAGDHYAFWKMEKIDNTETFNSEKNPDLIIFITDITLAVERWNPVPTDRETAAFSKSTAKVFFEKIRFEMNKKTGELIIPEETADRVGQFFATWDTDGAILPHYFDEELLETYEINFQNGDNS